MLTFTESLDGDLIAFWMGERIGSFEMRGSGDWDGQAIYRDAVYCTCDHDEGGLPMRFIRPAIERMCAAVDARRNAA